MIAWARKLRLRTGPVTTGELFASVPFGHFTEIGHIMKLGPGGRSPNLEDRRGRGMGGPLGIGGAVVMLILSLIFGPDIISDSGAGTSINSSGEVSPADSAREEPQVVFVSQVLDDVQST